MANEEDNFDIDIYGDGGEDYQEEGQVADAEQTAEDQAQSSEPNDDHNAPSDDNITNQDHSNTNNTDGGSQKIGSTDNTTVDALQVPKHAPQTQGLKRRGSADHRPVDQGATAALFVSELHWWITDDDIRGWANQSECEDELEEITFSEHKVNGKSKGYVYSPNRHYTILMKLMLDKDKSMFSFLRHRPQVPQNARLSPLVMARRTDKSLVSLSRTNLRTHSRPSPKTEMLAITTKEIDPLQAVLTRQELEGKAKIISILVVFVVVGAATIIIVVACLIWVVIAAAASNSPCLGAIKVP